jgi:DNA-binding transcriptional ArsR family regulator
VKAINPLELLTWWEGRGGRRPASLRKIAKILGASPTTIRNHLNTLRAAGEVDDRAREHALAAKGGHPPGGRPGRPLRDGVLLKAWYQTSSLTATARRLRVRRTRVRARLRALRLLEREPATRRDPNAD